MKNKSVVVSLLGKRVKILREAIGQTQTGLSKILDIHPFAIHRIEVGYRGYLIKEDVIQKIAGFFDVSKEWLLSDVDDTEDITTKTIISRVKVKGHLIMAARDAGIREDIIPDLVSELGNIINLVGKARKLVT